MLGGCYLQVTSLSYEGPTSGEGHFFFSFHRTSSLLPSGSRPLPLGLTARSK